MRHSQFRVNEYFPLVLPPYNKGIIYDTLAPALNIILIKTEPN